MSRHLIKMLIGFVGMGLLGLIGLFLINLYEKEQKGSIESQATPIGTNFPSRSN